MRSAAHSAQRGKPLMIKKFGAVALAAAIALQCVPAMANGIMVEANGARAHGRWGGELGLGYTLSAGGFSLRPIVGAFIYQGDNDRYYEDDLSNGQTRCRDSTNGQRSEEHTSELQSLMRISYAVFCLKKKKNSMRLQKSK